MGIFWIIEFSCISVTEQRHEESWAGKGRKNRETDIEYNILREYGCVEFLLERQFFLFRKIMEEIFEG